MKFTQLLSVVIGSDCIELYNIKHALAVEQLTLVYK